MIKLIKRILIRLGIIKSEVYMSDEWITEYENRYPTDGIN